MIIGTGIDIVELDRIESSLARHGDRFVERVFTSREQELATSRRKTAAQFYAGRWAAKEAMAKALGCGFGEHCGWLDIEVVNDGPGKPHIELSGQAAATAERMGIEQLHVSISHEKTYACAFVIAERKAAE